MIAQALTVSEALAAARETRRLEIDRGILGQTPALFHDVCPGREAILIADTNTFAAAGAEDFHPHPVTMLARQAELVGAEHRRPWREGQEGVDPLADEQLHVLGDGGVDGVVNEDRLGLDRVYVQAKRYAEGNSVGRPDVQAFVGSLVGLGASKGVFVTTSTYSTQAREFVKHLSQRVILIDGQTLADLMIEHNVGVRTSRAIQFKRIDEDFFTEDGE